LSSEKPMILCALIPSLIVLLTVSALADRGMVPLSDALVYGPGQKAIVAWNGVEEILILSTDVYADRESSVLEILPLPSRPEYINATDLSPFEAIADLLPRVAAPGRGKSLGQGDVEVVFHEKIGSHDITVVRAQDAVALEDWVNGYLGKAGMKERISSKRLAGLVNRYIADGYPYFVLDLIDAKTEPKSVQPIIYRFRSPALYFPLRISTLASGTTDITIFAISKGPVFDRDLPGSLSIARSGSLKQPLRFRVGGSALRSIDPRIGSILGDAAWITVITYSGDIDALDADLRLDTKSTTLGDWLVSNPIFWLLSGIILGLLFGLVLAQMNLGLLGIHYRRLVSTVDLAIFLLLILVTSVLGFPWAGYAFWILVPLATAALYFSIRTSGRGILIVYLAVPFLLVLFVFSTLLGRAVEIALSLIFLAGFCFAAALPPTEGRSLSDALRRKSRWVRSRRRRSL